MSHKQRLSDLKAMSASQREDEIARLKKEHFNLRFQRATGQLENTSRFNLIRKDIARLLTFSRAAALKGGASSKTKG